MQALSLGPNRNRAAIIEPQRGGANVSSQDVASMVIDTGHDRTRWLAMAALGVSVWSWREQNSILSVSTLGPWLA